jgi:hypothetical protein
MHYTHSWPTMATSNTLIPESTALSCDAFLYRNIIAFLRYLAITRPYVPFAFYKLSQHMQVHIANNMQALKGVLRYLKHTISHGLHLVKETTLHLTAFCNVNRGGDIANRKSVGAKFCISWSKWKLMVLQ